MSNSKNYNRMVFLTTLSVYLGLVLVGATPPAMTHAALTQRFEIQNEFEIDDDLDKKPDDNQSEKAAKKDFPTLFARLLIEIKNEVESGKISLPLQTEFYADGSFSRSENSGGGSTVSDETLNLIIQNAINQKFQPEAFDLADSSDDSKTAKIRLESSGNNLLLKISFSKSNSEQFAEFLNREFSASAVSVKGNLLEQIYRNTKAASENNQVFIVTRLPRASIDEFLAENAAK